MSSEFPQQVTIYGTGLIGGSLALALKRAYPGVRIAGVDRPEVLRRALQLNIIDSDESIDADLIVLATPVSDILERLSDLSGSTALITDVGSTKSMICARAEELRLPFIGGHPMAGLEQSGPDAAKADLFRGATYFLCSIQSTPADALERMQKFITAIGATPRQMDPSEHDRLVAQISHLPQILSTVLANHTARYKDLAGPGLRSMTRLAGSPFPMWRDIFKTSGGLSHELQSFIERLQHLLDSLEAGDLDDIETLFKHEGTS